MKKQWFLFLIFFLSTFNTTYSFVQSDWFSKKTADDYSLLAALVENKVARDIVRTEKVHSINLFLQMIEEAENILSNPSSYSDEIYEALSTCYKDTYKEFWLHYSGIAQENLEGAKKILDQLFSYKQ